MLLIFAPLLLLAAALYARLAPTPIRRVLGLAELAAGLAAVSALLALVELVVAGPQTLELAVYRGWGLSLRLDAISVSLACLVTFVGMIVIRYSRRYLDGEPRQASFIAGISSTLAAVLLLVSAGNLGQLAGAWIATSLSLQRLLLFYPDRPRAQLAARRKYIVARSADAFLLLAVVCLATVASTPDIVELGARARGWAASGDIPALAQIAAIALVLAAALKSAQFPTHGWLIDVAETPTPVSALLHAGLINAGGFLIIRLAEVVIVQPLAPTLLVAIGGLTAILGSLTMLTQTRVKNTLAYSTITQMGFMLVECGLGAFSAALVHLIAHSMYKAHAFLRAGSTIERAEPGAVARRALPGPALLGACIGLGASLCLVSGWVLGFDPRHEPGVFVLGGVLVLGLSVPLASALADRVRPLTALVLAAGLFGVSTLYFGLQALARLGFAAALPTPVSPAVPTAIVGGLALLGFAAVVVLEARARRLGSSGLWARLHVLAKNDFYLGRSAELTRVTDPRTRRTQA